ncbi:hypothetical protein ACFPIJ_47365 [Dactylosporangium cerinum]|uniref:Secreted protein n=1 Tax=Dactylosporangium cerinum TaxID=1434730 RepID=A0ABV9WD47_9ACTN
MDAAAWLSGLLALAGVGIGSLLSAWAQGRAWKREQMRQWQDARRGAYGRLVAAVRQYRGYVAGPHAEVELWLRPDGSRLIPGIGTAGAGYQEAMETAFTDVQLLAQSQDTVDRAHFLTSVARRIAVARAVHGPGRVPVELDERLFTAEREFINGVRRELGLFNIDATPLVGELEDIDAALYTAYRNRADP